MSAPEALHQLFFELSHEHRHMMLRLLRDRPMRITDFAKEMELHNPEIRRHLSRLQAIKLIYRDVEGFYLLSPLGELVLTQLKELEFTTRFMQYFASHSMINLPNTMIRRLSDLRKSTFTVNIMDFLYQIELIVKESEQYVWMNVASYPVTALASILGALERGVEFRIIEQEDQVTGPHLTLNDVNGAQAFHRVRSTPLIEQRTVPNVNIIIYVSEKKCAVAFQNRAGEFDYQGFIATDNEARTWCKDVFLSFWDSADSLVYLSPMKYLRPPRIQPSPLTTRKQVTVIGHDDVTIDVRAVQEAVDLFDEVILKGTFNFGISSVQISRSVVIKTEDATDASVGATIYKSGWRFPFTELDAVFKVDGEGADVTIQNLHFTDFNHACIWGCRCHRLTIQHNTITLGSGYGRGMSFGAFGDVIVGILIHEPQFNTFEGRVIIEGNTIDFASGGAWGGFLSRGGLEESPEYRPDLLNHEYYMSFGVAVHQSSSVIRIENNIIRNANARGIAATGNFASADIRIRGNDITTDVYGSYPFTSPEAGAGILVQSAWGVASPGFKVTIEENTIKSEKLNYSGIIALGPVTDRGSSGKLTGGIIQQNRIHLNAGYEGIHVRKCDDFEVTNNTIRGDMYYGIRISGRRQSKTLDLRARSNVVKNNEMRDIHIRPSDAYTSAHQDGRMFPSQANKIVTAHVWLDQHTEANTIQLTTRTEIVIDEGKNTVILHR